LHQLSFSASTALHLKSLKYCTLIEKLNIADPDIPKEDRYLFLDNIQLSDGIEAVEVV
jgi:hypothetical protein